MARLPICRPDQATISSIEWRLIVQMLPHVMVGGATATQRSDPLPSLGAASIRAMTGPGAGQAVRDDPTVTRTALVWLQAIVPGGTAQSRTILSLALLLDASRQFGRLPARRRRRTEVYRRHVARRTL